MFGRVRSFLHGACCCRREALSRRSASRMLHSHECLFRTSARGATATTSLVGRTASSDTDHGVSVCDMRGIIVFWRLFCLAVADDDRSHGSKTVFFQKQSHLLGPLVPDSARFCPTSGTTGRFLARRKRPEPGPYPIGQSLERTVSSSFRNR